MKTSFIVTVSTLCLAELLEECPAHNVVAGCLNGIEFVAVDQAVDFEGAISVCSDVGAFVAGVTNVEEHNFIVNLTNNLGIPQEDDFWLGNNSYFMCCC